MMAKPWSLRSWMLVALIVVPYVALKEWFGFEWPMWTRWISIALFFFFGGLLVISPQGTPGMKPAFARAAGVLFLIFAVGGSYLLFTGSFPE